MVIYIKILACGNINYIFELHGTAKLFLRLILILHAGWRKFRDSKETVI